MFVGELYANAFKTVAIALVYSPVWPIATLLTPIGLLVAYFCFNFAVTHTRREAPTSRTVALL